MQWKSGQNKMRLRTGIENYQAKSYIKTLDQKLSPDWSKWWGMENVRLEFVKALQISVNTRRIRRQFRGIRSWINRFQLGIILQINISWKGETSQRGLKHEYIHRGNIFDRYDRPRPHETLCCNKQRKVICLYSDIDNDIYIDNKMTK